MWPLDIAVAFWPEDKPSDVTIVHRLRTITTKDARAKGAAAFSPTMVMHSKVELFDSGGRDWRGPRSRSSAACGSQQ